MILIAFEIINTKVYSGIECDASNLNQKFLKMEIYNYSIAHRMKIW